jgi:hypothetical protein
LATLLSNMAERLSAAWGYIQRVADDHVRVAAICICLIATAMYFLPVMLALTVPPPHAMVEGSFKNRLVSNVHDIDAAPPSLPVEHTADHIAAGSGIGGQYAARQEVSAPRQRIAPPLPAATALPSRAAGLPKPARPDAYERSSQDARPAPDQPHPQRPDSYSYARQPAGERSSQDGGPLPYQPYQRPDSYFDAHQPDEDRSSQDGRPPPYQSYQREDSYYARQPDRGRALRDGHPVPHLRREDPYYPRWSDDGPTYSYSSPPYGTREDDDDRFVMGR